MISQIQNFDLLFSLFVQGSVGEFVQWISVMYSNRLLMSVVVVGLLLVIFLFDRRSMRGVALQMAVGFVFHLIVTEGILKNFFFRLRPYVLYPEQIIPYGRSFADSSWPSSHVVVVTLFTFILLRYYPKYWSIGAVVILFMAFSRIVNGMHFLTDVVSGVVIGVVYYLVVRFICSQFFLRMTHS